MTPHRPLSLSLLSLALGAALSAPAHAQSLLELVESARTYDTTWQSARAQLDAASRRADQARAGLLPSAALTAGLSRANVELSRPPVENTGTTQTVGVQASQPLYRPANRITLEQGQRGIDVAQAQLDAATQDLLVRVSQAYFDVLAAQDTLTCVQAQKAAVSEQLASAKRNFEVGTTTVTDSREAQARYDLVVAQEIAAENDLRVKRLALDQLVGITGTKPQPLALPVQLPTVQPDNVTTWVDTARDQQPGVRQAAIALDIARLETKKAETGHLPTLDLQVGYNVTRNPNGTITAPGVNNRTNSASVGVAFNLPLFAGFAVQNRVKETLALEGKGQRRPGDHAPQRSPGHARRLLWRAIRPGPGAGPGGCRSLQPECARCQQARLSGGRAHQHRRAQCPKPALPDQARPGPGPLQRAARHTEIAPGGGHADAAGH